MRLLSGRIFLSVFAVTVCALLGAENRVAADDAPALEGDAAQIQGTWIPFEMQMGAMRIPENSLEAYRLTFDGDKVVPPQGDNGSFQLDPAQSPKQIDIFAEGNKLLGIYKFEDDVFVLCLSPPGKDRPTDFVVEEGADTALAKMKKSEK